MGYVLTDVNLVATTLADPDAAVATFRYEVESPQVPGAGQMFTVAPEGGSAELRIDIDEEADRAALVWLPDGSYGIELAAADGITVYWFTDARPIEVPAQFARVSTATATNAVREYVATGQRPTCVRWSLEHGPYPFL
ncbi:Imm1 family immunity protein [Dactylosporangium siamense]|uniref:Immunity protein Imm1 n=1 Tax=Dactylosporangium siamense TaxID=685454 RepID=A0A919U7U6_9ACTN|nr:Imm1 family immunity protein [Dactylosporangium siamense]GIG44997.1 hypothetical protein Dsi01nite_030380 [Dactylosporangium siamense]